MQHSKGTIIFGLTKCRSRWNVKRNAEGNFRLWWKDTLYYSSNGSTFYDGNQYGDQTICYSSGDTLGCHIRRVCIDNTHYAICSFEKNAVPIRNSKFVIKDAATLYPTIAFDASGTVIEAKLYQHHLLHDQEGNY